jgi:hypothetical protein
MIVLRPSSTLSMNERSLRFNISSVCLISQHVLSLPSYHLVYKMSLWIKESAVLSSRCTIRFEVKRILIGQQSRARTGIIQNSFQVWIFSSTGERFSLYTKYEYVHL